VKHEFRAITDTEGQRDNAVMMFGEELLLGVAAHTGEREHRDRRLVGERKDRGALGRRGFGRDLSSRETNSVDPNWTGNIFEALVAHILECQVEPTGSVFLNTRRDTIPPGSANPSRRAATFTPSPKMSSPSTTISPWWTPIRNSIRLASGRAALRSAMRCCHSVAQRS
jgi:hypothetical protein